jgi:1,4-dihydroxy-2-naphthoyl-CoA hydrolase
MTTGGLLGQKQAYLRSPMLTGIFDTNTISLDELNQRCEHTMADFLGIRFTRITPDSLEATMPVDHRTVQPLRMLNGGASFALAENLGSMAANLALDRSRFVALGLEMNGNHIKSALEGETVTGITRALHLGRSTHVWEITIVNQHQQPLFIGRLTMSVKSLSNEGIK